MELIIDDVFRRALGHDVASRFPAAWPKIDNPIRAFDDVQVMFDHQDGIAFLDQLIQDR